MDTNSIGTFQFLNLRGQPERPGAMAQEYRRPNIEGVDVKVMAKQGRRFQLTSAVSTQNITSGEALYEQYLGLIDANPVKLIWMNHDFQVVDNLTTKVLAIRKTILEQRLNIQPQLPAPPPRHEAWLECRWDLLSVAIVAP